MLNNHPNIPADTHEDAQQDADVYREEFRKTKNTRRSYTPRRCGIYRANTFSRYSAGRGSGEPFHGSPITRYHRDGTFNAGYADSQMF